MVYGSATSRQTPKNCQRDKWCSTVHQMRNPPPIRITIQFMKWMTIENHGQAPVWCLYEVHHLTVLPHRALECAAFIFAIFSSPYSYRSVALIHSFRNAT